MMQCIILRPVMAEKQPPWRSWNSAAPQLDISKHVLMFLVLIRKMLMVTHQKAYSLQEVMYNQRLYYSVRCGSWRREGKSL